MLEAVAVFFDDADFVHEFFDKFFGDFPGEDEAALVVVAVFLVAFDAGVEELGFEGVVVDVVGEDFSIVEGAGGGGDHALHLEAAAAFDGEDVGVGKGEAADFEGTFAIAFVNHADLDGVLAEGGFDFALEDVVDFFPGEGLAEVDYDHVSGGGVGEDGPFHGDLLDVDDEGGEDGVDGAGAAFVFFAEAEDVALFELAADFFPWLAEAVLDEVDEFVRIALGGDPFDGEVSPGDKGAVEIADLHGALVRLGFGVGGDPYAKLEEVVFFVVLDFAAELAEVVGVEADFFEVGLAGEVFELGAFVGDAVPDEGLDVIAVGAWDVVFFLGAGEVFDGGLVGLELWR